MRKVVALLVACFAAVCMANFGPMNTTQHIGYLSVDGYSGKNHYFYWYQESQGNPATDPIVLWLTGGPGCASELALYMENGPYKLTGNPVEQVINPYSWNTNAAYFIIDQPVGTGFSYPDSLENLDTDETEVADQLYAALQSFFALYPALRAREFFVVAESYGGKYAPAIGYRILQGNQNGDGPKINLQGIGIGNGWTDPLIQYGAYGPFAYANGLINEVEYAAINVTDDICYELIANGLYDEAYVECMEGIVLPILALNPDMNVYDIRIDCEVEPLCYNTSLESTFLNYPSTQASLHVNTEWVTCSDEVHTALMGDWTENMEPVIPALLDAGIRVLVYSGADDFICNWMGGNMWTQAVEWSGQDQFTSLPLSPWKLNGQVVGEYRSFKPLTFLKVLNAGHMVPMDQPQVALAMLNNFLQGAF